VANYAGLNEDELPGEADGIIQECDGLPLALAMVAAMLRDEPNSRWADVLDSLKKADLEEIQIQFPDYAFPSLIAAIEVSVKQLPKEIQKCYLDLAVFPEDTLIPEPALTVIWGREGKEVRRIASQLVNRSLATRDASTHLSLHDLQVDYVRNEDVRKQAGVESVSALHGRFLEVYAGRCTEGWPAGPRDGYYFEHLPWHLKEAGRTTELRQLLFNFNWLQTKLEATELNALIADYDYLPEDKDLQLVQSAIRLSAHVVTRDPRQLAGQLTGRLLGNTSPSIQTLLKQAARWRASPWLRPLNPNLTAPGGPLIRTLEGHTDWVCAVAVTPDGRRAVSASSDQTLRLWDLESGQTLRTLEGHADRVYAVAVTPDGRRAVSASGDRTLRLWDLETGKTLRTLEGHTDQVCTVALTPDGRLAVSGSVDQTLRLWDLETGQTIRTLEGHTDSVYAVAVTPDGRAVSASGGRTLWLWDLKSGQTLRTLKGHTEWVDAVAVTPDGRRAVSGSEDKTLRLWDLESGQTLRTLEGHTSIVRAVAVTPDGRHAVSASGDRTLRLWDLESGQTLRTFEGHTVEVSAVAVTSDGRRAVSASDRTLRLWDLESGQTLRTFEGHSDAVRAVAVTPDGRRAVSASSDQTLRLWDLESGQTLRTLEGHADRVYAVAVTPDGRRAVSASSDQTLRLWDLESGQTLRTLEGHTDSVYVAITPDWRRAVSASDVGPLRVWDLESGQTLRTLGGHTDSVYAVAVTTEQRSAVEAMLRSTDQVFALRGRTSTAAKPTNGFKVGDRVTWNYEARGGYGHVMTVPGVVTKLAGKRVEIVVPSQSKQARTRVGSITLPDSQWIRVTRWVEPEKLAPRHTRASPEEAARLIEPEPEIKPMDKIQVRQIDDPEWDRAQREVIAQVEPVGEKRQYLTVPYAEREEAKAAGAKWDWREKLWYIGPEGTRAGLARGSPKRVHGLSVLSW
jgi:WD40 repeat protein